jgi:hypothetical protein
LTIVLSYIIYDVKSYDKNNQIYEPLRAMTR